MKSAFVKWEEPPPVKQKRGSGGNSGPKVFDAAWLVMDLMTEPGRWALTDYRGDSAGLRIVHWCDSRGIRAEHAYRDGRVYVRVLP